MRVMAIFSWISELAEFLALGDEHPSFAGEVPLELKLNMTDTEIVVVEDSAAWDTNAVILKSTAVLSYHKALTERPLSCNLQNLEVVYIDLVERDPTAPGEKTGHVLQVGTMNLNLRLSYNDVKMFLRILDSIPKQLLLGGSKMDSANIDSLLEMGFSRDDCLRSLEACGGQHRRRCTLAHSECHGYQLLPEHCDEHVSDGHCQARHSCVCR
ncbi:hypothetical protein MTO96_016439 [Rhipicephalus appendiculatus]